MRILVSGSTGFVGTALVDVLSRSDAVITRLVRDKGWVHAVRWDPAADWIEEELLEDIDVVIHLAGENLTAGRWTQVRKSRIRDSRVASTRLLAGALARRERPPKVMVSASAIGYYGDRGVELLREDSSPGEGFLAELCQEWEAATEEAEEAGIRVVHLRTGMVLAPHGGALARLLRPFRFGLGGRLGHGGQIVSWIALDDLLGAITHAIFSPALAGPINCTAPETVTNQEFAKTLGRVLRRPALLPVPAWILRTMFGEMADAVLLSSARVEPRRLLTAGYRFRLPDLEGALSDMLRERPRRRRGEALEEEPLFPDSPGEIPGVRR